jgi:hypothetical protein
MRQTKARFQPFCGMVFQVGWTCFEFLPHPFFPDDKDAVFVLEGGTAFLYKVRNVDTGEFYALKVFKHAFRNEHIAQVTTFLAQYAHLPALHPEQRMCITKSTCPELIRTFPEIEYAILMSWVDTPTWAGLLLNAQAGARYTLDRARSLARATANALWSLETHGLAHADIAGGNLVPAPDWSQVQLLDIEEIYIPGMPPPLKFSRGSPGYQHRHPGLRGQWCPEGDRFAGAILLTEMLTWWNPRVRAHVAEESETLFRPEELQVSETPCWRAVRDTLGMLNPKLLSLFDQAWSSRTLAECPPMSTWATTLLADFS